MVSNRILKFTWDEWKWIAIIVMLGVVMYWTAIVVEPTYTLVRQATETQQNVQKLLDQGVSQQDQIINTQNNNTQKITNVVNQTRTILDNQLVIVRSLGNAADQVTNQSNLLLLQGVDLQKILEFFKTHFNETFLKAEQLERQRTADILGNVSRLDKIVSLQERGINETLVQELIEKEMRKWIEELKKNLTSNFS